MSKRTWLVGSLCVALFACGGDGNGSSDGGSDGKGNTDKSDGGVESDASTPDKPEPEDPHAACEHYIDCAREAIPTGVTPLIATYGAKGSCWSLASVEPEDCAAECTAARKALLAATPKAACGDCEADKDCDGDGICVDYECVAIGVCVCRPEYPDCDANFGEIPVDDCGDGSCAGWACSETSECSTEQSLVCASYKGAPKVCTEVCTDSDACSLSSEECSEERDDKGRGLCVPKKCKSHAECGLYGACRADGTCGCRDENSCTSEQECKH